MEVGLVTMNCFTGVVVVVMITVVSGCSEPLGGFVPPTPEDKVFNSGHVVVGTVTDLIYPDPKYGDQWGENTTYGARVHVRCTYKGAVLGDSIIIGAAGYIPGMCTSYDIEANSEYILFLDAKSGETYTQTEVAEPFSKVMTYLGICNMQMKYPMENGFTLKRKVCPHGTELQTCKHHTTTQKTPVVVPGVKKPDKTGETEKTQEPKDPGNGVASIVTSSAASVLFTFLLMLL